jgi:hypothetical protein
MGNMSTKPDDVEQDVWDAAQVVLNDYRNIFSPAYDGGFSKTELIEPIIAALLAGRELISTPSRESSDELATLAAKYLGMSDAELYQLINSRRALGIEDIRRLAGSIVSQSENDK